MAYVYRHIRLDKNQPFYIGIGSDDEGKYIRAYDFNVKSRRNTYWSRIVNKCFIEVEIMLDNLTWEEACVKEQEFIKLYGRVCDGGILTNVTLGGNGAFGYQHTKDAKKKISQALHSRPKESDFTRQLKSLKKTGLLFSIEHKANISKALKGKSRSLESRLKQQQTIKLKKSVGFEQAEQIIKSLIQ